MEVRIYGNAADIGADIADIIAQQIKQKPGCVLGLATGSSPLPTYAGLIELYKAGAVSFKDVHTFNLDEYCDLPRDDKNSYYTFMHENLFDSVDICEDNVHFLNGNAPDREAECKHYDSSVLSSGGIDLQLLGIGNNAHIGFNEPAREFTNGSFEVKLTESTLEANKRYFPDRDMPHYALTMGVGQIMKAKSIILIATGEKKAKAVCDMIEGTVTPEVPASVLQKHADVTVFLDKAAASLLTEVK